MSRGGLSRTVWYRAASVRPFLGCLRAAWGCSAGAAAVAAAAAASAVAAAAVAAAVAAACAAAVPAAAVAVQSCMRQGKVLTLIAIFVGMFCQVTNFSKNPWGTVGVYNVSLP